MPTSVQTIDSLRRWANLLFSWAQIAVTIWSFALGRSFEDAAGSISADPPIVPARYAFIIWSVIYAGCAAYGIYQFLPDRSRDGLDSLPLVVFSDASVGCFVFARGTCHGRSRASSGWPPLSSALSLRSARLRVRHGFSG